MSEKDDDDKLDEFLKNELIYKLKILIMKIN